VDGDGIADKAVGAPYAAPSSSGTGALLLYRGSASGFSASPTQVLRGDDTLGYALVNVGADLAVGAIHGNGADVSLSGSVTIYRGGGSGAIVKVLSGEWPLDKFGLSLASGDLDGDAIPDLVVGAPFNTNDPARYQGGAVYVYLGPDYVTRIALYASATYGGIGWAVAAGDLSGDGIDDLVISAAGKVLVFYGATGFAPSIDAPDFSYTSAAAGFGRALAVLGAVDGVQGSELAIGAPSAVLSLNTLTSRDVGSVFVVNASGATPVALDAAVAGPAGPLLARLDGETLFSRFGASLAALGDVDGGGKPDLAVGAPMQDVDWKLLSGKVFVFKGEQIAAGSPWGSVSAFEGMVRDHSYGTALAAALLPGPAGSTHALLIGAPRSEGGTGGVAMVDAATGLDVAGGSSGGDAGDGGSCH